MQHWQIKRIAFESTTITLNLFGRVPFFCFQDYLSRVIALLVLESKNNVWQWREKGHFLLHYTPSKSNAESVRDHSRLSR